MVFMVLSLDAKRMARDVKKKCTIIQQFRPSGVDQRHLMDTVVSSANLTLVRKHPHFHAIRVSGGTYG